jgi:hypothetical protein
MFGWGLSINKNGFTNPRIHNINTYTNWLKNNYYHMISIKISKQGKYYIANNNTRATEDYSFIEKINNKYYALKKHEDGLVNWYFYNIEINKIELSIKDARLISDRFDEDTFTLDRNTCFSVYNNSDLKELISIDKNDDLYNFYYIGNGYSIYENNIYKGSSKIGPISDFQILYENEDEKYRIIKLEDVSLFYINRGNYGLTNKGFTIFDKSIPKKINNLYVISKNFKNKNLFIFKTNNEYVVISGNQVIYKGEIDEENGNEIISYANYKMIEFSNESGHYIITNNQLVNGPFKVNKFEYNRIFKCKEYSLFYKDKCIIKHNHLDNTISIEQDSPFEFTLHLNVNTDVLFMNGNEYAKLSVGDDEYFYNDITNNFTKLETAIDLIPYIFVDEVFYLDHDLTEKSIKPHFDIRDLMISDYTYYKNNLYIIFRDEEVPEPSGKYIVYDVSNNCTLKTFESFYEFTNHQGFYLNDVKYHASSFIYTLDDNGKKIIKLPFKTRSIRVLEGMVKFQGMFDGTISLNLNEPIYLKEK